MSYREIDDTIRATFGNAKQGAGYGYSGVKRLNALPSTASSVSSALVIVATRLRKGSANSARGAARLVADARAVPPAARSGRRACRQSAADPSQPEGVRRSNQADSDPQVA